MREHFFGCMIWRARKSLIGEKRLKRVFRPRVMMLEERAMLAATLPPGFTETTVTTGIAGPTAMEFSPDGRLWVLEQGGNVKLVHGDGTTFTALHLALDSAGERGMLGIAFDPNFTANHFVYLYYTNSSDSGAPWAHNEHNQLSRFTVDDSNPQQPAFTNEAPILDWNNLTGATNHNGGAIHFGADGMLYADAGDNQQTFPKDGVLYRVSQTLDNLLGKQLRIDVSKFNSGMATRDDVTVGHLIPANNPFVGTATGINQLIYVLGLRNPFTFAIQPGTGRILINDVGENTWEEINDSIAGANYGWSGGDTDGFGHTPPSFAPGTYHEPLLAYAHSGMVSHATGAAIAGGTFYNPATVQFPSSYVGMYFYEDLVSGWIRYFNPNNANIALSPDGNSVAFASGTPGSLRDLKVDSAGNLYYLSGGDGSIRRISFQPPKISLTVGGGAPNFTTSWFNSGPVPIENMAQASLIDPSGSGNMTSMTVKLATFHTGDVLAVPILPGVSGSLTTTYSAGTLVLSGSDTLANYQKELRFVNYNNTSGGPGTSPVLVTFSASDAALSSTPVTATINIKIASGQVLGNRLFYNNSKYDNNDTAISASDDLAIASDKVGFGGAGLSSFSAVSGFSRGITGIMVDLASGIGTHSNINLTSGDVTFKISPVTFVTTTYNQLSTWTTAPTPANISVRLGAGTSGSDRLEITWANAKLTNTWLEVDVKANAHTGLTADDVFYFASVIGNSGVGDTTALSKDDASDFTATNNNIVGVTTPVWNVMDYTKDQKVDSNDGTVNTNNVFTLHYISNPTGPFAPAAGPSASASSVAAVASGLNLPTAVPSWLTGRLRNILDSQDVAKILRNLESQDTGQILQTIDQVAAKFHRNDDLLEGLLGDLGLEPPSALRSPAI